MPPKHDAGTATRHYRAFWQRRCRAAAVGAVLKPQGGNCAVLPVFTPDCVSFCEVSSHAANSKGRRLRFLGSHRRIVMLFYLILFAPDSFRNLFNQLELVPLLQPGQLVADLAGGKTTLRAQAEAVHFSASCIRSMWFYAAGLVPVPRPPLRRLASSCLAVFPAVRMPLPQIIWLVGLFLTPTPTAIIMPTKQSTPAAPIPATRTKAAVPGAATDQKS